MPHRKWFLREHKIETELLQAFFSSDAARRSAAGTARTAVVLSMGMLRPSSTPSEYGLRRRLKAAQDGDRQMVLILSAVLSNGLEAVEAARPAKC